MRVDLRLRDAGMSQQFLDDVQRLTLYYEPTREGMAQVVNPEVVDLGAFERGRPRSLERRNSTSLAPSEDPRRTGNVAVLPRA